MNAMLYVCSYIEEGRHRARGWFDSVWSWLVRAEIWQRVLVVGVAVLGLALMLPALLVVSLALAICAWALFWVREFVHLMRTPASAFPGRHDRMIWIVLMLVFAPIGPLAFCWFRQAQGMDCEMTAYVHSPKSNAPWDDEGWL